MVYVPVGVVYVLCRRVAPSVTPFEPTRPFAEIAAFQPDAPLAQAVTVAYEPLAFTVMICVELPTLTGTGNDGAAGAALVFSLVPPAAAVVRCVTVAGPVDSADALVATDAEGDADGDDVAVAEADDDALGDGDLRDLPRGDSVAAAGPEVASATDSACPCCPHDVASTIALAATRRVETRRELGCTVCSFVREKEGYGWSG
ncbi:hypothetical protein [Streptomyces sp. NPDC001743]|uniref:hypothetical protein n=1 Tax=Streptomyces sp. NPDC001743 TaxID=3154397 RepID=UPI0033343F85